MLDKIKRAIFPRWSWNGEVDLRSTPPLEPDYINATAYIPLASGLFLPIRREVHLGSPNFTKEAFHQALSALTLRAAFPSHWTSSHHSEWANACEHLFTPGRASFRDAHTRPVTSISSVGGFYCDAISHTGSLGTETWSHRSLVRETGNQRQGLQRRAIWCLTT